MDESEVHETVFEIQQKVVKEAEEACQELDASGQNDDAMRRKLCGDLHDAAALQRSQEVVLKLKFAADVPEKVSQAQLSMFVKVFPR